MRKNRLSVYVAVLATLACVLAVFVGCNHKDDNKNESELMSVGRDDMYVYEFKGKQYESDTALRIEDVKEEYRDKIETLVLPENSVVSGNAFANMKNLKKAVVTKGAYFRGNAFNDCENFTDLVFEEGVTHVYEYGFEKCKSVERITLPSTLTYLSSRAFKESKWFESQPDGMIYIGTYAYFYKGDMPENTKIVFKEGTTLIADYMFAGCAELVEVDMPDSVVHMGGNLFLSCQKLQAVKFSQNVTSATSFWDCPSIKEVVFPDKVEVIRSNTFRYCQSLMSVTIGKGFKRFSIGWFMPVVDHCPRLIQVYNKSGQDGEPISVDGMAYYVYTEENGGKLVETQKDAYYFIDDDEKLFVGYFGNDEENFVLDADTTGIFDGAYSGTKLKNIVIPEGVTRVSVAALSGDVSGIEKICLPSTIEDFSPFRSYDYFYDNSWCEKGITVEYNGTKEQWQKVKQDDEYIGCYKVTVICTDGTVVYGND